MSESDRSPGASRRDHAYFRAIEDAFIGLRGAPLLLSPDDWQLARRWRREGVPLELVCGVLEEVFRRRAERGARDPVRGLRFCAPAVEARWRRVRELQAAGREEAAEPLPVGERLERLAAAIPRRLPGAGRLAERVRALAGSAEEVEARLRALDGEMLSAAEKDLSAGERRQLAASVQGTLRALGDRLPAAERGAAAERLRAAAVRRGAGLPTLSLFAPEARGEPAAGG